MWETPWVRVSSWRLAQVTQPLVCLHILFSKLLFFSMTVCKREIINQSVLTWFKILVIVFLRNIRNWISILAVSQAGNFLYPATFNTNLVADWWWTVWFDIFFTISQQPNLHPCWRIHGTKCVQRTIALYQYKLLNLFPFYVIEFCEVVIFKPWTQYA